MKKSKSPFAEIDIAAPEKSVKIESVITKIQNEIPASPSKEPVLTFKPYNATITTLLNVRRGPGYEYEVVEVLQANTVEKILEENGEWGRIGRDKWVCLQYIQKL